MPRSRKHATVAPTPAREYKVRLPSDIADRIEAKAKAEGRPQNRIVINELASVPDLEKYRDLASLVADMEVVLARYSARITGLDLSDQLLSAVAAVLEADGGGALQAAVDKLRVVRAGMLAHDRTQAKG